ncbi:MAG: hypothetical protein OXI17_10040 [Gammaproteobacteria bacterium]|nr:hypothetical protein [Gammaproteobacteria bacterium]
MSDGRVARKFWQFGAFRLYSVDEIESLHWDHKATCDQLNQRTREILKLKTALADAMEAAENPRLVEDNIRLKAHNQRLLAGMASLRRQLKEAREDN